MIDRLAIIGVGLIGASLALALKQAGVVKHVVGCGRNRKNLQRGIELGVIDSFTTSITEVARGADIVVLAIPLGAMEMAFEQIGAGISEKTIITGGSAFNIKAESFRLGDFSQSEGEA